jgi:transcriptional regulator with XRE-family HTH domain
MRNQFDGLRFIMALKIWRKMHGFSVTDVIDLTGLPRSTYAFIESGDRLPDLAQFSRLCQLMEFDASEFFVSAEKVSHE